MTEDIKMIMDVTRDSMTKTLDHLEETLIHIRAGKADPRMLESLHVDYYGSMVPITQVANINTPDARTIKIQPWEKKMIDPIEKAILYANLGFNPSNNGEVIIINVPPLTEERRKELVKQARHEGESFKVGIRAARRDALEHFKNMKKEGLSEDLEREAADEVQKLTDTFNHKVDEKIKKKEEDIMKV